MSVKVQYIIVFVILAAIIIWLVYSLVRKRPGTHLHCAGCSLSETCRKKKLLDMTDHKPGSCNDCPSTDDCTQKNPFLSCGGGPEEESGSES